MARKSDPGLTAEQVAALHRDVLPATLEAHFQAFQRHLEKRDQIEQEQACHGFQVGDEVLVNRKINDTFMNIGRVLHVLPGNLITIKFMGEKETLPVGELALIPPAYESFEHAFHETTRNGFRKIPALRRIKLQGKDFANFRKKVMGWDAWATFEAQTEPPPHKKPLLPPTMETLGLRSTPWRARRDSMGIYHPCSCCPDCAQEAAKKGNTTNANKEPSSAPGEQLQQK